MILRNCEKLSPLSKILIFFDEFDSIANNNIGGTFRATMLKGIEKLRKIENIVICSATNYYDRLDEAIIRSGRFDEKFVNIAKKLKEFEHPIFFGPFFEVNMYWDPKYIPFLQQPQKISKKRLKRFVGKKMKILIDEKE